MPIPRGNLGKSAVSLSALTFGTMRLHPEHLGNIARADLLAELVEQGVDCFHTSTEYESFESFRTLLARIRVLFPGREFAIIGKVGVPHFGEKAFSKVRFEAEVDQYLLKLGLDCLDVVQWSLRYNLDREGERLRILARDAESIGETVDRLRSAGKLRSLVAFPYTMGVGTRSLAEPWCDGLALYVNPLERSLNALLDEALARGKGVVAIRPFAAGRALEADHTFDGPDRKVMDRLRRTWPDAPAGERAVKYVMSHPAVVTTVASVGSGEHAVEAAGWVENAHRDLDRFKDFVGQ